MAVLVFVVPAMSGCGRVNFEPLGADGDGGPGGVGDGQIAGDGTIGDDGAVPDAALATLPPGGEACASAVTIVFGTTGSASLSGATNDLTQFGCSGGPEIVYRISVPATANHRLVVQPTFNACMSITNACPPAGGASQTIVMGQTYDNSPQFQASQMFILIERTSGTGTSFDLTLY